MSPSLQSILALALVALSATWLLWRSFGKKKKAGCGGDCGCPASEFKASLPKAHSP